MRTWKPAILSFAILTVFCGFIYTGVVTCIAQVVFPKEANGSVITLKQADGTFEEIGSELIGQNFTSAEYLIGRPMKVTNLSPVSEEERVAVKNRVDFFHSLDIVNKQAIPIDLVTASGSGVDPYISPEAAYYQIPRISRLRGLKEEQIKNAIDNNTANRFLKIIGEPGVNVLKVNIELDKLEKNYLLEDDK